MKLIYMAHPVSGDVKGNLIRAKLWLKWLTNSREEPMAFVAPWITECEIWDDSDAEQRNNGLARCMAAIERCDELWLVGGRVSKGMEAEQLHAIGNGLTTVNLVAMGEVPPDHECKSVTLEAGIDRPWRCPGCWRAKTIEDWHKYWRELRPENYCDQCHQFIPINNACLMTPAGARRCLGCEGAKNYAKGFGPPASIWAAGKALGGSVSFGPAEANRAAKECAQYAAAVKLDGKTEGGFGPPTIPSIFASVESEFRDEIAKKVEENKVWPFTCVKCKVIMSDPEEIKHWTVGAICLPCSDKEAKPQVDPILEAIKLRGDPVGQAIRSAVDAFACTEGPFDGMFHLAGFGVAMAKGAGVKSLIDGKICAFILSSRSDVEMTKPGSSHYRLKAKPPVDERYERPEKINGQFRCSTCDSQLIDGGYCPSCSGIVG